MNKVQKQNTIVGCVVEKEVLGQKFESRCGLEERASKNKVKKHEQVVGDVAKEEVLEQMLECALVEAGASKEKLQKQNQVVRDIKGKVLEQKLESECAQEEGIAKENVQKQEEVLWCAEKKVLEQKLGSEYAREKGTEKNKVQKPDVVVNGDSMKEKLASECALEEGASKNRMVKQELGAAKKTRVQKSASVLNCGVDVQEQRDESAVKNNVKKISGEDYVEVKVRERLAAVEEQLEEEREKVGRMAVEVRGLKVEVGVLRKVMHLKEDEREQIKDWKGAVETPKPRGVCVTSKAGREKGECLDLLRVAGQEEQPKSGSRMDFKEKKVFFQEKIQSETGSPNFRNRTGRNGD